MCSEVRMYHTGRASHQIFQVKAHNLSYSKGCFEIHNRFFKGLRDTRVSVIVMDPWTNVLLFVPTQKIHISKPRWQISIEGRIIKYFWCICCHKSIKDQKLSMCASNHSKCIYFNNFHFAMESLCAAFIFQIKLSLSFRWWLPLFF